MTEPIGKPATARIDVPIYIQLMGWGDGWDTLQAGSHVYLVEKEGNQVRFLAGWRPGRAGSREGGFFAVDQLGCFDEVSGDSGPHLDA
jgi:hypothetical protein